MSELYHHGILGMKWGVRRTPEQLGHVENANRKKLAKQIEKHDRKKNTNASRFAAKVQEEARKKADETEAGKKLTALEEQIKNAKVGDVVRIDYEELSKMQSEYMNTAMDYIDSKRGEYMGILLNDLGYADTESGRKYLEDFFSET